MGRAGRDARPGRALRGEQAPLGECRPGDRRPFLARSPIRGQPPPIRLWEDLVSSIRGASEPRLVLSSEFLAQRARRPSAARRRTSIRPASTSPSPSARWRRILASQWQQNIQASSTTSFDDWLADLFKRPDGATESPLWHRHRHDRLIERWAGIVGPERVTAVVVDDRDHAQVLRMFEALLGLQRRHARAPGGSRESLADGGRGRGAARLQRGLQGGRPGPQAAHAHRQAGRRDPPEGARPGPRGAADRRTAVGAGSRGRDLARRRRQHRGLGRAGRRRPLAPDRGAHQQGGRRPPPGPRDPAVAGGVAVDRHPDRGRVRASRRRATRRGQGSFGGASGPGPCAVAPRRHHALPPHARDRARPLPEGAPQGPSNRWQARRRTIEARR